MTVDSNYESKRIAAVQALSYVQDGMLVGLGTGSTAKIFIEKLIERAREGLNIQTVASSEESHRQAEAGGLKVLSLREVSRIDLTVDGADEIDSQMNMIKGGGGALLREKIVATLSDQVVIIVDAKKLVEKLGKFPLAVEIVPYGYEGLVEQILDLGLKGSFRQKDGELFITDNQNLIYDIHFSTPPENLLYVHQQLKNLTGVVETGFFYQMATVAIVGHSNGDVKILS